MLGPIRQVGVYSRCTVIAASRRVVGKDRNATSSPGMYKRAGYGRPEPNPLSSEPASGTREVCRCVRLDVDHFAFAKVCPHPEFAHSFDTDVERALQANLCICSSLRWGVGSWAATKRSSSMSCGLVVVLPEALSMDPVQNLAF